MKGLQYLVIPITIICRLASILQYLTSPLSPSQVSLQGLSFAMYRATDGLAGLGSVTIELPRHWSTTTCLPPSPTPGDDPSFTTEKPQIIVEEPHAVFGDTPWTQQSGGCGKQGDFIQLGVKFLKSVNSSVESSERVGRVLLSEWAKFRWGVFSESGHQGDPLYPLWYSVRPPAWKPNVCSDVVPLTHTPACPPHLSARCPWPQTAVENATSSLLAIPQLPKVSGWGEVCRRGGVGGAWRGNRGREQGGMGGRREHAALVSPRLPVYVNRSCVA